MTETSILPGASLESDAGNSMVPPPADVEETGGDNRRRQFCGNAEFHLKGVRGRTLERAGALR